VNKFINFTLTILIIFAICVDKAIAEDMLTWQDCVREAAKNNPDLISAKEVVKQEKATKFSTQSGLLPQVTGSVDASRSESTSSVTSSTIKNSFSYGADGTQLIFDGFQTFNDINAATENVKASKENYRFVSSEVRLNLRTAFASLLKAQELIKVAEDILKIRRSNLELITLRYMSGLEHRGALLTAEANAAQATYEVAQARRDVVSAQKELARQMGQKNFSPISVQGDFTVRDTAEEKPDFMEVISTNPSILKAAATKNAALFSKKSAIGSFLPEISGNAGASRSGKSWVPKNNQWNFGATLSMPIFEGGLKLAQLSEADATYKKAIADEESARNTAIVSLEQTWASLRDTIENVGVNAQILNATEERARISEAQYSTGFITFDNWIIIQNDLVNAKKAYLNAEAGALIAEANWIQAKGETLEYAQ